MGIVCSQLFAMQHTVSEDVSALSAQAADEQNEDHSYISIASFSLPSPVTVQLNLDPHFLFEIVLEDAAKQEDHTVDPSPVAQKLLTTLFRVIISPNAP